MGSLLKFLAKPDLLKNCNLIRNFSVNMGKRRNGQKKGNGARHTTRTNYADIVKENANYENYYKGQKCFDLSEFDSFMEAMRNPLPATFRLTGYKKDAKQLLKNMKNIHFQNMKGLQINGEDVKTPTPLPWYPEELAWKTFFSRVQLRSNPGLGSFHRFTISETEAGYITRQEAVSMIPPLLLDVQPHHKILDMCAAPGSKTAQLVELLHKDESKPIPDGICIANDKDNKRCYMLVHQIQRLNSPSSLIVNHDAAHFPEIYVKQDDGTTSKLRYDRVLCDVPCSGDGTLRKNTDIWKTWRCQNATALHGIQLRILIRGLELLEEDGVVVYSTCSINPIEDEAVVAAAIEKCEGSIELVESGLPGMQWSKGVSSWKVMDKKLNWYNSFADVPEGFTFLPKTLFPPEKADEYNLDRCMRFLPHHQDTGGFFVAVLRKTKALPWQKDVKLVVPEKSAGDGSISPPRKKRKWQGGYNEDPFVFFNEQQKPIVDSIRSFYGLSDDFPDKQLLSRSHQDKKKRIYFVSDLCKNILENNIDFLKVINTGVRMFSRCDNTHETIKCDFRLVQDGNECLAPYLKSRIIPVGMSDTIKLLSNEQPKYADVSEDFRKRLAEEDTGSLVLSFEPAEGDSVDCGFLMCAWRGQNAIRLYLSRHERIHHLNLIAQPIPEYLQLNKNSHQKRSDDAAAEQKAADDAAAANGNGEKKEVAIKVEQVESKADAAPNGNGEKKEVAIKVEKNEAEETAAAKEN